MPRGHFELSCLGVLGVIKWSVFVYSSICMLRATQKRTENRKNFPKNLFHAGLDPKMFGNKAGIEAQEVYPTTEKWWKRKIKQVPYILLHI